MDRADVVVIGAGPAGAVAALTLAREGVDVLLLEASDGGRLRVGEGLPPRARPLLEALGLLERFEAGGHQESYASCSAWGSRELRATDSILNPYGPGWRLDRRAFDAMLVHAAVEAGARVRFSMPVREVTRAPDGKGYELHGRAPGPPVRSAFLIDCSGRRAVCARREGARRLIYDRLVAAVAILCPRIVRDHDSTIVIEAVRDGWWYTALLPGGRRIMAYFTDGDLLDLPAARTVAGWSALLGGTEYMRQLCDGYAYQMLCPPHVLAAGSSCLTRPAGEGWVAAGDAVASFDPLSSQGIVTAMATGRWAALALTDHANGDRTALTGYAALVDTLYLDYLGKLNRHYSWEHRWPHAPFWRRRQRHLGPLPLHTGSGRTA